MGTSKKDRRQRERARKLFETLYGDGNPLSIEDLALKVTEHEVRIGTLEHNVEKVLAWMEKINYRLVLGLGGIAATLIIMLINLTLSSLGR